MAQQYWKCPECDESNPYPEAKICESCSAPIPRAELERLGKALPPPAKSRQLGTSVTAETKPSEPTRSPQTGSTVTPVPKPDVPPSRTAGTTPSPKPVPKPETKSEPKSEPKPEPKPEPIYEPKPEPKPTPPSETKTGPKSDPKPPPAPPPAPEPPSGSDSRPITIPKPRERAERARRQRIVRAADYIRRNITNCAVLLFVISLLTTAGSVIRIHTDDRPDALRTELSTFIDRTSASVQDIVGNAFPQRFRDNLAALPDRLAEFQLSDIPDIWSDFDARLDEYAQTEQ